ncbi:MAG: hypothetical protein IJY09_04645 [Lachnospiraceae bacterium]|nr:hypothetical protein [Lachnospiraceae bacterium]
MIQKQERTQAQLYCNCCGRRLKSVDGVLREDALCVKKEWGYFSKKDLQVHSFLVCEACYDRMIKQFHIPVTVEEKREVL